MRVLVLADMPCVDLLQGRLQCRRARRLATSAPPTGQAKPTAPCTTAGASPAPSSSAGMVWRQLCAETNSSSFQAYKAASEAKGAALEVRKAPSLSVCLHVHSCLQLADALQAASEMHIEAALLKNLCCPAQELPGVVPSGCAVPWCGSWCAVDSPCPASVPFAFTCLYMHALHHSGSESSGMYAVCNFVAAFDVCVPLRRASAIYIRGSDFHKALGWSSGRPWASDAPEPVRWQRLWLERSTLHLVGAGMPRAPRMEGTSSCGPALWIRCASPVHAIHGRQA